MLEQEMRTRVFHFLKARMRNMIMPATVGLGLVVGGSCQSAAVYSAPFYQDAAAIKADVSGTPIYSAPMDARWPLPQNDGGGADLPLAPDAGGAVDADKVDTLVSEAGSSDTPPATDGRGDLGGMKYMGPFQDAAPLDVSDDVVAPTPDGALDGGPALRYMAQMPRTGNDGTLGLLHTARPPRGV